MDRLIGVLFGGKIVAGLRLVQGLLSGKKAYLAGGILILQGLSCLADQLLAMQTSAEVVAFLRGLHQDQCVALLAQGLGVIGIRAGIAKGK